MYSGFCGHNKKHAVTFEFYISLLQHYEDIGQEYDVYYKYIHKAYIYGILSHVPIGVDDHILDIGGGTGELAHIVWKHFGLRQPILCVEPSESLLVAARKKEGVVAVKATAEEFFSSPPKQLMFNVVLINSCYHHFQNPGFVLSGVRDCLQKDGVGVIISNESLLPIISAAHALYNLTDDTLDLIRSSGLKAEVKQVVRNYTVDKHYWYTFMRKKMYSSLRPFSDEQIEAGIEELEKQYGDDSELQMEIKLRMIFIKHN